MNELNSANKRNKANIRAFLKSAINMWHLCFFYDSQVKYSLIEVENRRTERF